MASMFGDYSRDLLRAGIIEFKAGNHPAARRYLDRCVYMSSDHSVMAEAWYWLSQTVDDPLERRQALENCLANDFHHAPARRALALLDGKLQPAQIIDPDLPVPAAEFQNGHPKRFTCSRCGGRMVYTSDGRSLICEYCRRHERIEPAGISASENDFILALATARGHSRPLRDQVRRCGGCGAEFIRPGAELSFNCPYCDSSSVMEVAPSGELMAPDGILPHSFDQRRAIDIVAPWRKMQEMEIAGPAPMPRGLYLPIWTFTFSGDIEYTGESASQSGDSVPGDQPGSATIRGHYPVTQRLSVPASRRPSAAFVRLISGFDLAGLQPYDARYLAAWPAELYDVPMAEASLEARSQVYAGLQGELSSKLKPLRITSTSSAGLVIESFRLDLLPVWICELRLAGHGSILLINGVNGSIAGEGPRPVAPARSSVLEWLGDLLRE